VSNLRPEPIHRDFRHLEVKVLPEQLIDVHLLIERLQTNSHLTSLGVKSGLHICTSGAKILAGCSQLKSLDVRANRILNEGAEYLAANTYLTSLNVSSNFIDAIGASFFTQNVTLTSLNIGGNRLGPEGASVLARNSHLTHLDIRTNNIGDAGAIALATHPRLTSLSVYNNLIASEGLTALTNNTRLRTLNIGSNKLEINDVILIATVTNLTALDLSSNGIGNAAAMVLAKNSFLRMLDLGGNYSVGDEGAIALVKSINLTSLVLCSLNIGNETAKQLARNTTLTFLSIKHTVIDDQGAMELMNNTSIIEIQCGVNDFSRESSDQLKQATRFNKKAKELQFVESVIEIARSKRIGQESSLKAVPNDILILILSYVAGIYLREHTESITAVCKFIFETVQKTGKFQWRLGNHQSTFFKAWDVQERQAVLSRYPKKPEIHLCQK
jgi:hypothetical protein